jgi:proteic killer suppression protein
MIRSFVDHPTANPFQRHAPGQMDRRLAQRTADKLRMIGAARQVEDLRVPPGKRLERLRGDLAGFWSIRARDQRRIVFRFVQEDAIDVPFVDDQ